MFRASPNSVQAATRAEIAEARPAAIAAADSTVDLVRTTGRAARALLGTTPAAISAEGTVMPRRVSRNLKRSPAGASRPATVPAGQPSWPAACSRVIAPRSQSTIGAPGTSPAAGRSPRGASERRASRSASPWCARHPDVRARRSTARRRAGLGPGPEGQSPGDAVEPARQRITVADRCLHSAPARGTWPGTRRPRRCGSASTSRHTRRTIGPVPLHEQRRRRPPASPAAAPRDAIEATACPVQPAQHCRCSQERVCTACRTACGPVRSP